MDSIISLLLVGGICVLITTIIAIVVIIIPFFKFLNTEKRKLYLELKHSYEEINENEKAKKHERGADIDE